MLNDLLGFTKPQLDNIKIKFNQHNGNADPLELYQKDPEILNTHWLFAKKQRDYFHAGQLAMCFLKLSYDTWLLTTIKQIAKKLNVSTGVTYEGYELSEYRQYYGRVIVKYHKRTRSQGLFYKNIYRELVVNEILPAAFEGDNFPGYDNVRLSYEQLAAIIRCAKRDWIAALAHQKAVYLITDVYHGLMYVGSATGDNGMLLQRWSDYVANGHGGNAKLKTLVATEGFDYIKRNFQYSILENYNAKINDDVILTREAWWKKTLQTVKFGYNEK